MADNQTAPVIPAANQPDSVLVTSADAPVNDAIPDPGNEPAPLAPPVPDPIPIPPAAEATQPRAPQAPIVPPGHPPIPVFDPNKPDRPIAGRFPGMPEPQPGQKRPAPVRPERAAKVAALIAADPDGIGLKDMTPAQRLAALTAPRRKAATGRPLNRPGIVAAIGPVKAAAIMAKLRAAGKTNPQVAEFVAMLENVGFDPNSTEGAKVVTSLKTAGAIDDSDAAALRDSATELVSVATAEGLGALTLDDVLRAS